MTLPHLMSINLAVYIGVRYSWQKKVIKQGTLTTPGAPGLARSEWFTYVPQSWRNYLKTLIIQNCIKLYELHSAIWSCDLVKMICEQKFLSFGPMSLWFKWKWLFLFVKNLHFSFSQEVQEGRVVSKPCRGHGRHWCCGLLTGHRL